FRMLREGLLAEVRTATNQAKAENNVVTRDAVQLAEGSTTRVVRVEVVPLKVPPSGVRFFLVLFQETSQAEHAPPPTPEVQFAQNDLKVTQLQQEIGALREYLQSVIEE